MMWTCPGGPAEADGGSSPLSRQIVVLGGNTEMARIATEEFRDRIERIQEGLRDRKLDGLMVYGDEYRKENLRYVSNCWPIFERGACFIPAAGEPILAGAPEGERYAREMGAWDDVRNLRELACVSVPEEIDYPLAEFATLEDVLADTLRGGRRLGLIGSRDIPAGLLTRVGTAAPGVEIVTCDDLMEQMRIVKTAAEIACLREAGRQACAGYERLMELAVPGNTERAASGAAEGAARMAGAEAINFTVFASGPRTETIIGRPTERVIRDGDMVMACVAVQYEGYVATAGFPFVTGQPSAEQQGLIEVLLEAADVQMRYLRAGVVAGDMVRAVKAVFQKHGVAQYDVYPPMHGVGLAEAESPYPDEDSEYPFRAGTCVNSDISLFGHPAGSNRIEEGFVITDGHPDSLTPLIGRLRERGI
jgi:Xaa-Pro aminopeptidase